MTAVRFVIDIEVEEGDAAEVSDALFAGREAIANFAKDVVVRADDNVDTSRLKIKATGGHSHPGHDTSGSYCEVCDKYARHQILKPFDED